MGRSSFQRALAWVRHHQESAPSRWPPDGLARLDDTWFSDHPTRGSLMVAAAAFEGLPEDLAARARAACGVHASRRSRLPPSLSEVCARWSWSHLVDLPPATDHESALLHETTNDTPDDHLAAALPRLSARTVVQAVSLAGLDDLGGLLARAPDRAAATICGRLPPAWRQRVWQARTTRTPPDHVALAELTTMTRTGDPTEVLFSLGAVRFAPLLAPHPLWRLQTAQLLPVVVARHLLGAVASLAASTDTVPLLSALREATGSPDPQ
jgi:hypothetical protein